MKKVLFIIGMVIVSLVAAFYLFILFGSFFDPEPIDFSYESIGMAILISLTAISVIVTWFKRRIGVWMVLGAGISFSIFGMVTAGQRKWMAVLAAGGPLIVGAVLMILGERENKSKEEVTE
jgi:hypothetical protein